MIQREIQRVKELQLSNKPRLPVYNKGDSGHINIYSITVKLNRNFCLHESYAFLVLMKTDDVIEATDLVTLMDTRTMRVNSVHFNDQIQFGNLPSDFSLKLEVFALVGFLSFESCSVSAKLLLSPCKLRKANLNGSVIGTTGFTSCGYTHITKTRAGDFEVYLDATEYPLEGTINVKSSWSSTTTSASVDFSGFLAMYEVIADLGSWSRYWAVLQNGVINFWRDPNDEASSKVKKADLNFYFFYCRRMSGHFFFFFDVCMLAQFSCRIFLSADSKEMLDSWIDVLNRSLKRIDK
uniref:PH domain-containing protein n=1 Tax=Syphacia muris TaxID=451379 RepID=A0A0N5AVX3_9BILA